LRPGFTENKRPAGHLRPTRSKSGGVHIFLSSAHIETMTEADVSMASQNLREMEEAEEGSSADQPEEGRENPLPACKKVLVLKFSDFRPQARRSRA